MGLILFFIILATEEEGRFATRSNVPVAKKKHF